MARTKRESGMGADVGGRWPLMMVVSCFAALGLLYSYGIYRALHPPPAHVRTTEENSLPATQEDSSSKPSSESSN